VLGAHQCLGLMLGEEHVRETSSTIACDPRDKQLLPPPCLNIPADRADETPLGLRCQAQRPPSGSKRCIGGKDGWWRIPLVPVQILGAAGRVLAAPLYTYTTFPDGDWWKGSRGRRKGVMRVKGLKVGKGGEGARPR